MKNIQFMNRGLRFGGIMILAAAMLVACQSKEQRAVSRLESLAERVEQNGEKYDEGQWDEVFEQYEEIHEEMRGCDFTNEQLREIGRIDGRQTALLTKQYLRVCGEAMGEVVSGMGSFAEGFAEGLDEEGVMDEIEALGEEMKSLIGEL